MSTSMPVFFMEGKPENFKLSTEEQLKLAALPLEGKTPVLANKPKIAVILWGPPNSGKTTRAAELIKQEYAPILDHMVAISYDEHTLGGKTGALFNIPAYGAAYDKEVALQKAGGTPDRETLNDLYREYRDDSQRIRSMTLKMAAEAGHHLCIDTTSSGGGTFKMVEILKQAGYGQIHFVGAIAPLRVAVPRSEERLRLVEPIEVFDKRAGAFETLPGILETANKLVLLQNAVDGQNPEILLRAEDGAITEKNAQALRHLTNYTSKDIDFCRQHPVGQAFADRLATSTTGLIDALNGPLVAARQAPTGTRPHPKA